MINKLKSLVRKYLKSQGTTFHFFKKEKYLYTNVFKTSFEKNVLICHFTAAYTGSPKKNHTVYAEAIAIGETFQELGYNVDVVNYDRWLAPNEIDVNKYDLFFGQGDSLESIFHYDKEKLKLRYCTGLSIMTSNRNSIKRIHDFHKRNNKLIVSSGLIVNARVNLQMNFADYLFFWGNDWGKETFENDYNFNKDKILNLPAFFYKTQKLRPKIGKDFLWMGSVGCIHRGLDLVLEYFIKNPEYNLHVCGNVSNEIDFFNFYKDKIGNNIKFYGFVDINSDLFGEILEKCRFQIYLSAGEGTSASVLTGIGNGALIPIISQECCFNNQNIGVVLKSYTYNEIDNAIKMLYSYQNQELEEQAIKLYNYVNAFHTTENYKKTLKKYLSDILIA